MDMGYSLAPWAISGDDPKDSGIVNDANLRATETTGDASYPPKLFQRVITVSVEAMKIVRGLLRLDIAVAVKG